MKSAQDGVASAEANKMGCCMKFLTPEALAAAIIGKGGAVIASMRQSCQAKVTLSDHGEVYPQTDCRVLTAQAGTEELLSEVCKQVIGKLDEVAKSSSSEAVGKEGEVKLRTVVPRAAVGGVIGKGGATIKTIRETSGAKVSIGDPAGSGPSAEQLVTVVGSSQAVEYVMTEVNKQIQMLKSEPWFSAWASTISTVDTVPATHGVASQLVTGAASSGLDVMTRAAQGLPPYVMEDSRGFAMSCVVPNHLVGGLIGRGGAGTREVQNTTNTKISIREIPEDPDNRSLNITGPLPNTCAAYMLMMKRYLDAEAQATRGGGRSKPR